MCKFRWGAVTPYVVADRAAVWVAPIIRAYDEDSPIVVDWEGGPLIFSRYIVRQWTLVGMHVNDRCRPNGSPNYFVGSNGMKPPTPTRFLPLAHVWVLTHRSPIGADYIIDYRVDLIGHIAR